MRAFVHQAAPPQAGGKTDVIDSWLNAKGERVEQTANGLRVVQNANATSVGPREHPNVKATEDELKGSNVVATVNTETGVVEAAFMPIKPYYEKDAK